MVPGGHLQMECDNAHRSRLPRAHLGSPSAADPLRQLPCQTDLVSTAEVNFNE